MRHEETKNLGNGMFIHTHEGEYFFSVMGDEIETYKISPFQYFNARDLSDRSVDQYLAELLDFCRFYDGLKKK